MSDTSLSIGPARFLRMVVVGLAVTVGLILAAGAARGHGPAAMLAGFLHLKGQLHTPNFGLLAVAPIQIKIHVAAVSTALAIGIVLMLGLKGNTVHRTLGWIWVTAMATAAISSLFIHRANAGSFSFLHLFAGWTLIALPMGVFAARKHKVRLHGRTMTGLFVGGLLIAGAFAFLPGRLMWQVVFG
ncbi:hypothetical protein ASD21_04775 [Caulobacter sp. Root1455]|uniref:DUF2306 domain-containing protein n=1 Tax=unclassified Caulobacter TaxID=2648921 RepID=UPI000701441D|nr:MULTISPECIES: DUF2306 domain-containing protein [unclassified Caulobacter]KQY29592.1 hypothetical protein ASD38_09655 [Caulobacter sp. Root487D2Y]KQY95826.1 hypothetical protein ASD21_04775 [Caulobacter sp. Root1455]